MNDKGETKFEERLNKILSAEGDVNEILDELNDEDNQKTQLPTVVSYTDVPSVVDAGESGLNQDQVDDYKYARKTLYGVIDRGTVALEGAMIIARESEHPKAFDVVSSLMRNISETVKELVSLQKSLKPDVKIGKQVNQQNNFYGNPANQEDESDPKDITNLLDQLDDD